MLILEARNRLTVLHKFDQTRSETLLQTYEQRMQESRYDFDLQPVADANAKILLIVF